MRHDGNILLIVDLADRWRRDQPLVAQTDLLLMSARWRTIIDRYPVSLFSEVTLTRRKIYYFVPRHVIGKRSDSATYPTGAFRCTRVYLFEHYANTMTNSSMEG